MRQAERMMWVFAALFIIFGILFALSGEDSLFYKSFGGLCMASLACFALALAYDGHNEGRIKAQNSIIERDKNPLMFKLYVGMVAVAGFGVLIAAFWVMFLRT